MNRPLLLALLLALFLLLGADRAFSERRLFRSNSLGMLLEEIEPSARHEYSHVMIVEEEQASETSRLFSENKELKRWERSFFADGKEREERQYIEGRLEALRIFAEDGNILEEREYASENAEQRETKRTRYQYRAGVLSSVEVFDGSGASLYRERYAYTKKGFLREIARSYPDGSLSVSAFIFGCGEGLVETRSRQDSRVQIYRYDTSGRIKTCRSVLSLGVIIPIARHPTG
jgi:hypothetical protein